MAFSDHKRCVVPFWQSSEGIFFWVIISVSLSIPMGKWPQRFLLSQMWKEEFWFFYPPKLLIFSLPSRKVFLKFELEFEVWIIIDIIIEANRYQDQDNRLVISVKWWISLTEDPWWKYQRKLDWSRDSDLTVGWCTMMYRWWLAIRLLECTLILLLLSDDRKQMNVALETGR